MLENWALQWFELAQRVADGNTVRITCDQQASRRLLSRWSNFKKAIKNDGTPDDLRMVGAAKVSLTPAGIEWVPREGDWDARLISEALEKAK